GGGRQAEKLITPEGLPLVGQFRMPFRVGVENSYRLWARGTPGTRIPLLARQRTTCRIACLPLRETLVQHPGGGGRPPAAPPGTALLLVLSGAPRRAREPPDNYAFA